MGKEQSQESTQEDSDSISYYRPDDNLSNNSKQPNPLYCAEPINENFKIALDQHHKEEEINKNLDKKDSETK